jgi:lon-related putative ATP-dependent protease
MLTDEPRSGPPPAHPSIAQENVHMARPTELSASALYRPCAPAQPGAAGSADGGRFAHGRAASAIDLGVAMRSRGYNVFALGPAGTGKLTLVRKLIAQQPKPDAEPPDWCYLHNFKVAHKPRVLSLPAGRGAALRRDLREFVEELSAAIPAVFESDEYRTRIEHIGARIDERAQAAFEAVGQEASRRGIALVHTPAGFSLAPVKDGEVMAPEEFAALPEERQAALREAIESLQGRLQEAIRSAQRLQTERRAQIRDLGREMTLAVVSSLVDDLAAKYARFPSVVDHLAQVQQDILDHIDDFRRPGEQPALPIGMPDGQQETVRRYEVNVIVGEDRDHGTVPVVVEDYPSHPNLMGRVEHVARFGTLVTDFTLIKAGALHRANGGYLLIDAHKLLMQPFAWDGLKRALSSARIHMESLGQAYGLVSTVALEPEPIPLDVKVILFGDRRTYYLLLTLDPEFGELFKIAADFEDDVERTPATEGQLRRVLVEFAVDAGLPAFREDAIARVVEHAARVTGDATRLSTELERLGDLLRESASMAGAASAEGVTREAVERALEAARHRSGRVRGALQRAILDDELLIETAGERVGQVNGLSVSTIGQDSFGHPTRITATTRLGAGEVVDIQREVELGGPLHSKGVLILAAFLSSRYSAEIPHSLAASLVFEQTYGPVDGDSASLGELCALLSSLAELPIRQSLAVTGSVDQHGRVQPIGGVNEKIEGFFDVCKARGLDGSHGVLIPAANARHLMLASDIVEAAAAGRFHVYACESVDDAIELLTGVDAGRPDPYGGFPIDSVNGRILVKLQRYAELRQAFTRDGSATRETDRRTGSLPAPKAP